MIYVLGMSHAINVLKAAAAQPLSFTHENWTTLVGSGRFFDLATTPGLVPGEMLKAFIASPGVGWGLVADFQSGADGQRQVAAVAGYIELLRSIESAQHGNTLVSFIHGNEHSGLSLTRHSVAYDFFVPGSNQDHMDAGVQPVLLEVVQRQVKKAARHTLASLAMARILLPAMRIVHVLPPPPIASEQHILQHPEGFTEALAARGLSPLSLRVKYYELYSNVLRQGGAEFNIEILSVPEEAIQANGAVRDDLAYGATHANEAYGLLVARQLAAFA